MPLCPESTFQLQTASAKPPSFRERCLFSIFLFAIQSTTQNYDVDEVHSSACSYRRQPLTQPINFNNSEGGRVREGKNEILKRGPIPKIDQLLWAALKRTAATNARILSITEDDMHRRDIASNSRSDFGVEVEEEK